VWMVFSAVRLDGYAIWLVGRVHLGLRRYLMSKWFGYLVVFLVLAEFLVFLSNMWIGTTVCLMFKSALVVDDLVVASTGLGMGMGAAFPRFHIDNAAKIATGLGGVLFMFLALTLTLMVMMLDAIPTYWLLVANYSQNLGLPDAFALKAGAAWGGALVLCGVASVGAIELGVRRLGSR